MMPKNISSQEKPLKMAKRKLTIKDIEHISIRDLAFKIKEVDDYINNPKSEETRVSRKPNLAFFLGAGASKDSGVILASEMTKIFKDKLFDINCHEMKTDEEKAEWLKAQDWYQGGKREYGCLFEKFRDTKSGRQRFIEAVCYRNPLTEKTVEPSFGYLIMADLLLRNYINTVITTNFDDLVYIAATTFTGNRPIVYAYGILASEMKMILSHSKVLKLHGDYLYSNIVNTADEMSAQSNAVKNPDKVQEVINNLNMERQVRTVLDNFGLIVVGYAGGDETIMELLKEVSKDNGFYWCYLEKYPPGTNVLEIIKSKNGKLVKIIGFDEMMKEIADITKFSIEDLLKSFEQRKEKLKERITKFEREYTNKSLNQYAVELKDENNAENLTAIDYFILGEEAFEEGKFIIAEENYCKAIELNPEYITAYLQLSALYISELNKLEKAEEILQRAIKIEPYNSNVYNYLGVLLYKQGNIEEAIKILQKSANLDKDFANPRLHLASIYKRIGNKKESNKYIDQAKAIIGDREYHNLAGLNSILDNKDTAFKLLKLAVKKDLQRKSRAKDTPALEWLRDDERFREIIDRDE